MNIPTIILSTINARYIHSALGLRYLLANMGELTSRTRLLEFITTNPPLDIVERLLQPQPTIVGFGVYIWNVEITSHVIHLIKQIDPRVIIVVGGPEVSFETQEQPIAQVADYVITGPADTAFAELCRAITNGDPPIQKIISAPPASLDTLALPYAYYSDEDIKNRVLYVEASRGCPFKCEFCLSALDKTAVAFDLDIFLDQMQALYQRGARRFKFVDRTFNLKIDSCIRILEFFLARLDANLFLHFELVPDQLPERLKTVIGRFPKGVLQFEIGVQTFNEHTQFLINRKQDNAKTVANIAWLRDHTCSHLHTDLIVGLPAEDVNSFAAGFNRLVALDPHEIQVGVLKRLRGAPIIRHTHTYSMKYNPFAPYNILSSDLISFEKMQELSRFARYWDLIANSGRFPNTKALLLGNDPFQRFMRFSLWLYETTRATHRIALPKLFEHLYQGLIQVLYAEPTVAADRLGRDYCISGLKGSPSFADKKTLQQLREEMYQPPPTTAPADQLPEQAFHALTPDSALSPPPRQARHLR